MPSERGRDPRVTLTRLRIMTNHVHLLASPLRENSIPKVMQYNLTGTLWEGGYKATLIDSEHYLFACMRYIELNPLRAQMAVIQKSIPCPAIMLVL